MPVALQAVRQTSTAVAQPVVEMRDVKLTYVSKREEVTALEGIDLAVQRGEFVAIVGPSGCGKSTLLHLAAGLIKPTLGEISLFGRPVNGLASGVGYMFQTDGLLPWKTVSDNLALPLRIQGRPAAESRERVRDWLRRVGLSRFGSAYPSQLSGGMRKRAALAQTLIQNPELVLMDEPFSALDVQTRVMIGNDLSTLWGNLRNTVLLVTHDLEEAIGLADRVVVLSARPARIKAVYEVDLPRPRDLTEIRLHPAFQHLYAAIWSNLREEVLIAHAQQN